MNDAWPELPIDLTSEVRMRRAELRDLDSILRLLADDPVSAGRGDRNRPEDRPAYERAFTAIDRDPAQLLLVTESEGDGIIGTMQLSLLPGLARRGAMRLQIEAVRVRSDRRSAGIGGRMIRWAMESAPGMGAALVQLTSDAAREDAHRFYERLGFTASHVGFKYAPPAAAVSPPD
ncbi:MAG TPA: GNAT family N-acetyltransferase [Agromyces sp.]|nr:GNAT family N-acetyltransferase [Agromyces sp.]